MADIIGFVGFESEDIVLYLAYCLSVCGKKVAIEDRTEHSMLLRMLEAEEKKIKEENAEIFYQGFYITNSVVQKEKYDTVLLLFGYRLRHPKLYECNQLVMVTDALPAHAGILAEIEPWERKQVLIIRDGMEAKHGVHYLELLTGQRAEQVLCLPREVKDIRIRNSLGSAQSIRIEKLSAAMKELLELLITCLYPEGSEIYHKKIRKGIR